MEHISELSKRIRTLTPNASHPLEGIEFNVKCFVYDIIGIIKNINETSINYSDRQSRLSKLEEQTGLTLKDKI